MMLNHYFSNKSMGKLSEKYRKFLAKSMFEISSMNEEPQTVLIEDIPTERSQFLNTKCFWQRVDFPKELNVTGCLFTAPAGFVFRKHNHPPGIKKTISILTEGTSLRYYTNDRVEDVIHPNGVMFQPEEDHRVRFFDDMTVLIKWHPAFLDGKWHGDIK